MRQAIVTKYLGPTNCRGSRVKATSQAGSVTIPWDNSLGSGANHDAAAVALAAKFGWPTDNMFGGAMPDGRGNCYVIADQWSRVGRPDDAR